VSSERLKGDATLFDPRFEAIKGDLLLVKWMLGTLITMAAANFSKKFF